MAEATELAPVPFPEVAKHGWWFRHLGLPFSKVVCNTILFFFGSVRAKHKDRLPKTGGVLILANHLSDLDPIAVAVACPRPIHFMAKSDLFSMKVVGTMLRWFRAFPVKRGEPDRASLKHAIELLKLGEVVCIFPEGQLSESGKLQPLKPGISLIIRNAGVQVICLGFSKTNHVMPYGQFVLRMTFQTIPMNWGMPRSFDKSSTPEEIVEWATAELLQLSGLEKESEVDSIDPTSPSSG